MRARGASAAAGSRAISATSSGVTRASRSWSEPCQSAGA
jgi:hypothetical protein